MKTPQTEYSANIQQPIDRSTKKVKTNADRIRAMSDDELGTFLTKVFTDGAKYEVYGTPPETVPHPMEFPDWLRKEADNG